MNDAIAGLAYLGAASLFILGLKRLSSPRTARLGNQMAAVGMLIAVVVTLIDQSMASYGVIVAGVVVGSGVGALAALRVPMTSMPELVAAFNGFGGGASALVATTEFLTATGSSVESSVTIVVSTAVGALTFSGSFIAFGKLRGFVPGRPITFFGQLVVSSLLAIGVIGAGIWVVSAGGVLPIWVLAGLAAILGVIRVLPIGGADMPVVIALLNSMSGLAAASAGFVIESVALIIGGALVGASGLVLTTIMGRAMNRSIWDVLFGTFGSEDASTAAVEDRPVRPTTAEDVAIALGFAQSVIVVPGYGLAVAQAQHALREVADVLEAQSVDVRYAIHPVAGRMPGHMNVLLAEADVPYEQLVEMDDINPEFSRTDVALVIGANDVVNPAAHEDASSPIYGMPVLRVEDARLVVVIKRSMASGFAGIDNPLFYRENCSMLFSDAKQALSDLARALKDL